MRNLICGDIHGDQFNLCDIFNLAKSHNCQRIINVGDFGFFPGIDRCESFLDLCSNLIFQTGIQFSFVDGNHEDHQFLNQFSGEVRNVWKGIEWNWRGKIFDGICSFGGAYSIDKEYNQTFLILQNHNRKSILAQKCFLKSFFSYFSCRRASKNPVSNVALQEVKYFALSKSENFRAKHSFFHLFPKKEK